MKSAQSGHRLRAIAITMGLHLFFAGLLYLLVLHSTRPERMKGVELVLVDLGDTPNALGESEPEGKQTDGKEISSEPVQPSTPIVPISNKVVPEPKPTPSSIPKPQPSIPINTQKHEESLPMAEAKHIEAEQKLREVRERAEMQKAKAEQDRLAAEQKKKEEQRKQIGNSVSGLFNGAGLSNGSQGNSNGTGNQGVTNGRSGTLNLVGRTIVNNGGNLARPNVNKAVRGRVVVRITVNASGKVTHAEILPKGTNISDPTIRNSSIVAAKQTQFNPHPDAEDQTGTISYNFDIK